MELTIFADCRESFLFDGCRTEFNTTEDRGVENVNACIDPVPYKLDRFLYEAIDSRRMVGFMYHNTVFTGFFDFSDNDGTLFAVRFVEFGELLEGIVADHVGV